MSIPHELAWGEVYFPPLLLALAIAYGLTMLVSSVIVKSGLYRFVAHPAIAEVCLVILFIGLIGLFIPLF
ncbi:DUF1656 domain-containing protein [Vibrio scophthalmi]|uniref:DUF1656 domain-containing protein n=1 Tax=Vibrio scophthalmi TaxID=45658 RepID=UPI002FF035CE